MTIISEKEKGIYFSPDDWTGQIMLRAFAKTPSTRTRVSRVTNRVMVAAGEHQESESPTCGIASAGVDNGNGDAICAPVLSPHGAARAAP